MIWSDALAVLPALFPQLLASHFIQNFALPIVSCCLSAPRFGPCALKADFHRRYPIPPPPFPATPVPSWAPSRSRCTYHRSSPLYLQLSRGSQSCRHFPLLLPGFYGP